MLKLTILGCGTFSGVPRIGGDWGACDPSDSRNRRRRASILVESETTCLLVDTGPDMREQLLDAGVGSLDAVLWTHDHADHCHGIDDLRQIAQHSHSVVQGYGRRETMELLTRRFNYAFAGRMGYRPIIEALILPDDPFRIGDIEIDMIDQPHGEIFSTGFRFTRNGMSIGYSTDFHLATDEMIAFFTGVDIWVADVLRQRPHPTHAHLELTLEAIAKIGPGRAILTHMDNSLDYAELSARLPDHVEPGYDGLTVILGEGGSARYA